MINMQEIPCKFLGMKSSTSREKILREYIYKWLLSFISLHFYTSNNKQNLWKMLVFLEDKTIVFKILKI